MLCCSKVACMCLLGVEKSVMKKPILVVAVVQSRTLAKWLFSVVRVKILYNGN